MEFTDDVHMKTPPVLSANHPDPLLELNEEEISSKEQLIRTNLGKSIVQDFGQYRDILDEHHERRERIIKVSRDINILSKQMIFALHRAQPKDYLPQFSSASEALLEFKEKHTTVLKLFHRVALDLQGSNYYRYQRSVSGPMQEYIEAMTLEYYMIHGRLMPKSALEKDLVFMTSSKMMANPDLIIGLGQVQSGGRGGGGGGSGGLKGKFGKDNRRGPYNKDKRGTGPAKQQPSPAGSTPIASESSPLVEKSTSTPETSETLDFTSKVVTPVDKNDAEDTPMAEDLMTKLTIEVTDEDYLLGIADLTGELMRLAINTLGQSMVAVPQPPGSETWSLPTPEERVQQILSFLREIKSGFDGLSLTKSSPIMKKMAVLRQSLNKIEVALYNVRVRGAEYPPEMMRQLLMSTQDIGGGDGGASGGGGGDEDDA
ncbi:hypothetical protein BGZ59_011316 [Podila verticillata]|nr:hypothetical protein BGZ59_011316 [Podila verticillata]KFH64160.1 hypothetical protein MVEG_09985 [Podila verticillata NRRL 6337]